MFYFTSDLHFNHKNVIKYCNRPGVSYHLHGHQHNGPEYNIEQRAAGLKRYDVGVDANGFKPVSIEEIIDFFKEEVQ